MVSSLFRSTVSKKALVLRTAGTNCDYETVTALELSGATVDLLHLSEVLAEPDRIHQYSLMVIPGGFSYGDDIAAGKILANELKLKLYKPLEKYVKEGKLLIGICNGFQVLVKSGLLPGNEAVMGIQEATLGHNLSGRFQCEWVSLFKEKSKAKWLDHLPKTFDLPIAHGEGRFMAKNSGTLRKLGQNGQVIFRYKGRNPNGSDQAIAGICNIAGNVVGLMPHPERYIDSTQHPAWTSRKITGSTPGLSFWQGAVQYANN